MKKFATFVALVLILASLGCNLPGAGGKSPVAPTAVSPVSATDTPIPPTVVVLPPTAIPATPTLTPTSIPPVVIPLTIVYLEARDVYIWRDGGMVTRLTATADICDLHLAPDASVVLFRRGADCYNSDLWAINADGSNMRLLFTDASFDALVPGQQNYLSKVEFIPGTTSVAFTTGYLIEGPGSPSNLDVQILDYVSGAHSVLLPSGSGAGGIDYSPNGSWVALVDGGKIEIMRPDGSDRRVVLTFPSVFTYSEWVYLPALTWSADSSSFRVIIPAQDPLGDPTALSRIYQVGTDGAVHELGQFVGSPVFISFPTFNPAGTYFAYVSETVPGSGIYQMHIAAADMSVDTVVLTGNQLEFIGWSTDSFQYLFWQNSMVILNLGSMGSAPFAFASTNELRGAKWVGPARFLVVAGAGVSPTLRLYSLDSTFVNLSGVSPDVFTNDFAPRP